MERHIGKEGKTFVHVEREGIGSGEVNMWRRVKVRWKAELSICLCVVGMRWLGGIWVVRDSEI